MTRPPLVKGGQGRRACELRAAAWIGSIALVLLILL